MDENKNFDLKKLQRKMLQKFPAFGTVINDLDYVITKDIQVAATDSKNIYINQETFEKMSFDEQLFVLSHEVSHVALDHMNRAKGKDPKVWNIATDAIINENLIKDGLVRPKDGVFMDGATKYNAEQLYDLLLEEQKEMQQNGPSSQNNSNNNQKNSLNDNGQKDSQGLEKQLKDCLSNSVTNHNLWDKADENKEQEQKQDTQKNDKDIFEQNRQQRRENAQKTIDKLGNSTPNLVEIGPLQENEKPIFDWKHKLVRMLEMEDEFWGHKLSSRETNYTARLEDTLVEDDASIEVILDTSGSVDKNLLISFLKQVKFLLKVGSLKLGTFADNFNGWQTIKSKKDIDNIRLNIGGGTNFNEASKAFSKSRDVIKICFTDGLDGGDAMIQDKRKDILWVSFENPHFKPDKGKVLFINRKEIYNEDEFVF